MKMARRKPKYQQKDTPPSDDNIFFQYISIGYQWGTKSGATSSLGFTYFGVDMFQEGLFLPSFSLIALF